MMIYLLLAIFFSCTLTVDINTAVEKSVERNFSKKKFTLNFNNKPLVDIINEFASEKQMNIILPQGAAGDALFKSNVTMHLKKPLTLDQVWKQIYTLLDLVGYTMEPERDMFIIRRIDANIAREPLDIYIDQSLDNLPNTEQIIKALFYLENINVKTSWDNLNAILKDILSTNANIQSDQKNNAILLTDKAVNIKSVMKIIFELDRGGVRDIIEVLPLYYTSAQIIDDLFNKQLLAPKQPAGGVAAPEQVSYFPKNTKVFGLDRTNSLVIMGTPYAIDLVKDFILKYIDRPLESGKSILHIYDLQYLQAESFAPVLQQMVSPSETDQAAGKIATGPKQYFRDVIIQSEIKRETDVITPKNPAGQPVTGAIQPIQEGAQVGGNRLIIAARHKDWLRIKKLIQELDKPQPQVALEVLIVDVSLSNDRLLGSQMRNKEGFNKSISQNVDFQSAQLTVPILKPGVSDVNDIGLGLGTQRPADALMANLLQLGSPFDTGENLASTARPGSLIISLEDTGGSGVWSVWQILNRYTQAVILAQPFVVTQNHKQASTSIETQRFVPGNADTASVAIPVTQEYITAALTIDIVPNINPQGNNINLQVVVNINDFTDAVSNTRITRIIQTNANVGNGEVLALGGLTRLRENIDQNEVPLLGKIPVLGWFFKRKAKVKEKNNLVVLICPTIIQPRAQGGTDPFSDRKLAFAKDDLDEHLLFENMRDPITRWFFKPEPCYGASAIDNYTQRTIKEQYEPLKPTQDPVYGSSQEDTIFVGSKEEEIKALRKLIDNTDNPLTSAKGTTLTGLQS